MLIGIRDCDKQTNKQTNKQTLVLALQPCAEVIGTLRTKRYEYRQLSMKLCLMYTNVHVSYIGLLTLNNKHCLGNMFKIVAFRQGSREGKMEGKGEINLVSRERCSTHAFAHAFAKQTAAS